MEDERLISNAAFDQNDVQTELSLRPQKLAQYIGQEKIKQKVAIYIEAAKNRQESLDHVLLYGPPGLGKTTLATIIANELGVKIKTTTGPAIERPGDLVALLNELEPGDVLLSMRSIECQRVSKRCFIQRWKIFISISSLDKMRPLIRSDFRYHRLL